MMFTEAQLRQDVIGQQAYLLSHEAVVEVQSQVEDACQGRLGLCHGDELLCLVQLDHIQGGDCDLHPEGLHLGDGVCLMAAAQAPAVM